METAHDEQRHFDNRNAARAFELSRDRRSFGQQHFRRTRHRQRTNSACDLSLPGLLRRTCDHARLCTHPFSGRAWIFRRTTARASLRSRRHVARALDPARCVSGLLLRRYSRTRLALRARRSRDRRERNHHSLYGARNDEFRGPLAVWIVALQVGPNRYVDDVPRAARHVVGLADARHGHNLVAADFQQGTGRIANRRHGAGNSGRDDRACRNDSGVAQPGEHRSRSVTQLRRFHRPRYRARIAGGPPDRGDLFFFGLSGYGSCAGREYHVAKPARDVAARSESVSWQWPSACRRVCDLRYCFRVAFAAQARTG